MVKKIHLLVLVFLIAQGINSQTPCSGGTAAGYPCNNIDLLSNIPISVLANSNGTPAGNDIWGWVDTTTNKEYALVGTTNSTAFVDVTDPINPIFLGRLDSNADNNAWRDVKVYNNHAFIVADNVGAHGMQVFDLTKLRTVTSPPVNFTADAIYTTDNLGSCHNVFINENTGVAYLVGCKDSSDQAIASGGPIFVDVSNPTSPTKINQYATEGYSHDAHVVIYNGPDTTYTGKEIYIGSNETKISILDVTNKNNVIKIKDISYGQLGYTHQGWFTEDHKYFILGDELDEQKNGLNTRTLIFDVQDLDNPFLSSTHYGASSAIDHNGYVKGNEFYMANYRAGFRLFDISNIGSGNNSTSMVEVGYFDTYPADDNTAFNGVWSIYPYLPSGNILIGDIEGGLFVVKKNGALAVENQAVKKPSFSIFPNPTEQNSTVFAKNNGQIHSIEIINLLGKIMFTKQNIASDKFQLPIQNFANGMYFVKINNTFSKKLVVK